jgi:hypothetical protein
VVAHPANHTAAPANAAILEKPPFTVPSSLVKYKLKQIQEHPRAAQARARLPRRRPVCNFRQKRLKNHKRTGFCSWHEVWNG